MNTRHHDYSIKALRGHDGANPNHTHPAGRAYRAVAVYNTGRHVISVKDTSRWKPHNGKREMARRVRKMEARADG
ncbi:MAG: hypothetical protein O9972_09630 [Burkholderiales bacterium]|nr:hypothetical protein [Burkholderiales bacterium]